MHHCQWFVPRIACLLMPIHRLCFPILGLMTALIAAAGSPVAAAQPGPTFGAQIKVPEQAQPILPLKEVRVGMTGYLSLIHIPSPRDA